MFAQCQAQWGPDSGRGAQTLLSLTIITADYPNHSSRHGAGSSRCSEATGLHLSTQAGHHTLGHQPYSPRQGQLEAGGQLTRWPLLLREKAEAHALSSAWGPCMFNGTSAKIIWQSFPQGLLVAGRSQVVCQGPCN